MIEFQAPTPADKAWVDELLALGNLRGCDYNFTNLYVWQRAYRFGIARVENFLMTHLYGRAGCSYMYPAGSGDIAAAIRALEADQLILDTLGDHVAQNYLEGKKKEWEEYRTRVSSWERERYIINY